MKFNLPALCVVACLAPAAAFAKCDKDVKTVFSCQTAKGKVIEVCDAGKTISYSFGLPTAKPEIVVTVPRAQASTSQWEGVGRYMSYSVNIPNGNGVYSVYWAADRMSDKHGIEAGAATNYRLASVSKQFTAAAILLLAQDGSLGIDDPVKRWLPSLPPATARITLPASDTFTVCGDWVRSSVIARALTPRAMSSPS